MNPNSAPLPDNHTDDLINHALFTLRDARPRAGLNNRILTSLDQRTATPATNPGAPSSRLKAAKVGIARGSARENARRTTTTLALWPALAACTIAVASFVILHHRTAAPELAPTQTAVIQSEPRSAHPKDPEDARLTTNPEPFSTTKPTQNLSSRPERAARSGETPVFVSCPDHQPTGCPIHDDSVVMGGVITTSPDPDAQALADLHTPSYPAPPLPLTTQEKLFLRMSRYGNATELAELNPMVRARQDAAETTAFKTFFPDPPPIPDSGDNE